jgi:hypothetical protein
VDSNYAPGCRLDDWGFESQKGLGIFLFTTASRPALGPTQSRIQWVLGALSLGVRRPGREADHSPPSSAEVKEWVELYLHSPSIPSWRRAQLKHRDNFTFSFYYHFRPEALYLAVVPSFSCSLCLLWLHCGEKLKVKVKVKVSLCFQLSTTPWRRIGGGDIAPLILWLRH